MLVCFDDSVLSVSELEDLGGIRCRRQGMGTGNGTLMVTGQHGRWSRGEQENKTSLIVASASREKARASSEQKAVTRVRREA